MIWKKKLLSNSKLYLILDAAVADYDRLFFIATQALKGGVDLLQLRDKYGCARDILNAAGKLRKLSDSKKALLIINDRIDLALAIGADGVHLGQEDIPLTVARTLIPKGFVIGISCQSLAQARAAQREGADYIGFGSVFKTLTKPNREPMDLKLLADVVRHARVPVFAIGGITGQNISQLIDLDVKRVAICRDICLAEDVCQATSNLKKELI